MNELQLLSMDGLWPSLSIIVLILAIGVSVLILWRRILSRRALMRRIAELETLSAAGRAIVASELDVHALCELIAQEAGAVIDNRTFQVGLFDQGFYEILYWQADGQPQKTPQKFDIHDNEGLICWVRDSRTPLLVRDFQREMDSLPAKPRYVSKTPPRSALYIPLFSGEDDVGIITAQSKDPDRFDEEDKRRLMILAHQASAAFANARLYESERMRAAHLELVSQIARQVNAVQDLDEILEQVVHLTQDTFGFFPVNIFHIEQPTRDAILKASGNPKIPSNDIRLPANCGLVGAAVANVETIVCNNTADDERFVATMENLPGDIAKDTSAEIAIPLVVDNQVLGVLDVHSPQVGVFTETEQTVLEALADEVASAIYKAQQLAWQQGQAWITTAQLQIADAISREQDLEEIASTITRLTPMLVGVSLCGIFLWKEEEGLYQGISLHGAGNKEVDTISEVLIQIGDWHALDAVHVGQEMITTSQIPQWLVKAFPKSDLPDDQLKILPLFPSGHTELLGVMIVDHVANQTPLHTDNQLAQRQDELLHNITNQTALALESANLRLAQQEEAWVNTALLQVAEAVNSLIDLNEILDTIVRLIPMLVGVQSVIILVRDEERKHFVPGPSFGISKMGRGLLATLELEEEELHKMTSISGTSNLSQASIYTVRLPGWLESVLETKNAYALSLNAQGRLVGTMMVGTSSSFGRQISQRRLNILNGIAQQAATAVVNNQLYKESADRARLQQELTVAHEIQSSFLPEGSPDIHGFSVASLWLAARQVSGDFYDFLPREDGTWGIVIADVADKGVPAALFMALSRTIIRTVGFNRRDPADVLMRVNEIINIDAASDLFVTVFYAIWDPVNLTITYANGGHNPPLLLKENGESSLLRAPGIALGVLPDIDIPSQSIKMARGDTLILYTDGVTEAINEDYDEYGLERLYWEARSVRQQDAATIVKTIRDSINDHAGGTPQFDDVTMVVMKKE